MALEHGNCVQAYALRPQSSEFPVGGYHGLLTDTISVLGTDDPMAGMNSFGSAQALKRALNETMPDGVAIVGYSSYVALAALAWCRWNRRGAILMSESQRIDFRRVGWKEWLKRRIVTRCDAALVGGSAQVDYMRTLGMPAERIFTAYDVVDNDFYAAWAARVRQAPEEWRALYDLPPRFFLTASRLVPKKNIAWLLRAFAQYAATTETPWHLVIAGDGPLDQELRTLARTLDIDPLVHFTSYLSADKLAPLYGLASAFILASAYSEQWGLVVNEAMAAGLPVMVSRICGCVPDLVQDKGVGVTFDPQDERQMVELFKSFSQNEMDLASMGERAQKVVARFSPEQFGHNLWSACDAAIRHARTRSFWI